MVSRIASIWPIGSGRAKGLIGQSVLEKQRILLSDVPDDYVRINSGLGESPPRNVVVLPVLFEEDVRAVFELASFQEFTPTHLALLEQLAESIGIVLNTISASMRTQELLKQSQSLTEELQSQQEELRETNDRLEKQAKSLRESEELLKSQREQLQQTNEELEEKAELLEQQNEEVEQKNREIERARRALQEKADQLALTSKYKSQFLANMSHELRTPLNSVLILAQMLEDNAEQNLTEKQVEFARNIHASGVDLLSLISDILDMSKIESGTVTVEASERLIRRNRAARGTHLPAACLAKGACSSESNRPPSCRPTSPPTSSVCSRSSRTCFPMPSSLRTREKSFSRCSRPSKAGASTIPCSARPAQVIAFSVRDTGVGIPADQLQIIFEPFQQVDMSSTRKYSGTGLGLSVSREIARLLGGEIRVESTPGKGSTFTLYLPDDYQPLPRPPEDQPASSPSAAGFRPESVLRQPSELAASRHGNARPTRHQNPGSPASGTGAEATAAHELNDDRRSHPKRRSRAADYRRRCTLCTHPVGDGPFP